MPRSPAGSWRFANNEIPGTYRKPNELFHGDRYKNLRYYAALRMLWPRPTVARMPSALFSGSAARATSRQRKQGILSRRYPHSLPRSVSMSIRIRIRVREASSLAGLEEQ